MKILIVCSGNKRSISPFVKEQADSIQKLGVEVDFFPIKGKGLLGYFKNIFKLRKKIRTSKPNLIHAHYGLSGFVCVFQKKIPFLVTYHGSDINSCEILRFSKIAMKYSACNIFVSQDLFQKSTLKMGEVIPCGIDLSSFYPIEKELARKKMNLELTKKYILFASNFDDQVKNYPLAKESVDLLNDSNIELIELKNYSRQEVALLLNAVDVLLMTSLNEGSPQIIKEAMACNCPIVSTNVGDVKQNIEKIVSCYITDFSSLEISEKLKEVLNQKRSNGRNFISDFDNNEIAKKLMLTYQKLLS